MKSIFSICCPHSVNNVPNKAHVVGFNFRGLSLFQEYLAHASGIALYSDTNLYHTNNMLLFYLHGGLTYTAQSNKISIFILRGLSKDGSSKAFMGIFEELEWKNRYTPISKFLK